jgi:hypothetical protein
LLRNASWALTFDASPPAQAGGKNSRTTPEEIMRSLILLGLGAPIPLILLLAFCTHHF